MNELSRLLLLYEVTAAAVGTLDSEELYRDFPARAARCLDVSGVALYEYRADVRRLVQKASWPENRAEWGSDSVVPGEGACGRAFLSGAPVHVSRDGGGMIPSFASAGPSRSFLAVPLISRGKPIGVIAAWHREPDAFDEGAVSAMRILSAHFAVAVENAEMFHFVKALAEKDSLTFLYNHGAFHDRLRIELERADRYDRPLSVIMLDLDRFKEINDRFGHSAGDRALVTSAGVLCSCLRKTDIPARYGGDEFAVILPETDLAAASIIAGRIAAGLAGVRLDIAGGEEVFFTASIGYAACSSHSRERDRIFLTADRLMYESKRRGPGGVLGETID